MRSHFVIGQLTSIEKSNDEWARYVQEIRRLLSRQFGVVWHEGYGVAQGRARGVMYILESVERRRSLHCYGGAADAVPPRQQHELASDGRDVPERQEVGFELRQPQRFDPLHDQGRRG